jgi:peptide/nickel transport system ATP-binding protein
MLKRYRLEIKGLKAYYFTSKGIVRAVDGVNIATDESIGIVGESGSGKSTLGYAIMRMLQPPGRIVGGEVILDGLDILNMDEHDFNKNVRWKKVSMVFQYAMNSLDPVYRIEDQMYEVLRYHSDNIYSSTRLESSSRYDSYRYRLVSEALKQVGLDESVLKRYPHELSGGMKQRVVIAMALLLKPSLLIADEPTTALDVLMQAQIINMLKRLKKNGLMIMLITHDLAIVAEVVDRVAIMYAGQVVEFNSSDNIYKDPKHPYTQVLINSIPRLKGEKKLSYIKGDPPNPLDYPKGCRFYARCPYAMDKCMQEPPDVSIGDGYVKCWLYTK